MKLTERILATLPGPTKGNQIIHYDDSVPGLGFRITANGAKAWTMDYTDAAGKRRRATLAQWPNLKLKWAQDRAREHRTDMARGEAGPLEAKRMARERAVAEQLRREQEKEQGKTLAELAAMWMQEHGEVNKRASSLRSDRSNLALYIKPRFGSVRVAELTNDEVKALHRDLAATPTQANRVLSLLHTLMNFAIQKKKLRTDNPCAGIKRYPESKRKVFATREELNRLYAELEKHPNRRAANAIKVLVWTGSRMGEVLQAEWPEFDLPRGWWHKPAAHTKQKKDSSIPLNPLALKLLREMHADRTGALLFPATSDPARPMYKEVRNLWAKVSKAAGLTLRIHDLRHVFATTALEAGVQLEAIAPLLGHSKTIMTERYAHISDRILTEATAKAAALLAANDGKAGLLPSP